MLLPQTNKALGQHWLTDENILQSIVAEAEISKDDFIVEIGPGPGYLTDNILQKTSSLLAIEFDNDLFKKLEKKYQANSGVKIVNQDILKFNFSDIQHPYKIVANIPYYLTSNLLRIVSDCDNKPNIAVLLVQKEVAERINSSEGNHSKLSIFVQNAYNTSLGPLVEAHYFTPPPKVDSQVIVLSKRDEELVPLGLKKQFSKVVRAGFSEKRKKLRSSLSGGLQLSKQEVDSLLAKTNINPDARAQELSINNWIQIASNFTM